MLAETAVSVAAGYAPASQDTPCSSICRGSSSSSEGYKLKLKGAQPDHLAWHEAEEDLRGLHATGPLADIAANATTVNDFMEKSICPEDEVQCAQPTSPKMWRRPSETLIILDWDDTLCPTSFLMGADTETTEAEIPTSREIEKHAATIASLLVQAAALGQVCIITLADEGWLKQSMDISMPSLRQLLEELKIQIIHARTALPSNTLRGRASDGFSSADISQTLKTAAMRSVVENFYLGKSGSGFRGQPRQQARLRSNLGPSSSRRSDRSWKNILSIGDSEAEYYSIQDVTFNHKQSDKCRCKAVKLIEKPALSTLTAQMQVLTSWLPCIVSHDGDINLDFETLGKESTHPFADS